MSEVDLHPSKTLVKGTATKEMLRRIDRSGIVGVENLIADILHIVAVESDRWTGRWDNAIQIPNMLFLTVRELREVAEERRIRRLLR